MSCGALPAVLWILSIRCNSLIVTELCDGTLHDLVVPHHKNSLTQLSSDRLKNAVLRQIVEGAKHLHDNGILHRDLKPKNILYRIIISDEGKRQLVMKVADFGCSRSVPGGDVTHYASASDRLVPTDGSHRKYSRRKGIETTSSGRHLSLGSHLCVHFVWRATSIRRRCDYERRFNKE